MDLSPDQPSAVCRMSRPVSDPAVVFAEAVALVEEELPWAELGRLYCHEGGDAFFMPDQIDAIREAGLKIASEVAAAVETATDARLDAGGSVSAPKPGTSGAPRRAGTSLYFGAAVAELVPALCERFVLGREIRLLNLPGTEATLVNGALARAEQRLEAQRGEPLARLLPRIEVDLKALDEARFDHLWIVSVFTDPEAFPALHDDLYKLLPSKKPMDPEGKEPTGRGNLPAERKRATQLLRKLLGRLELPGVVTTTDEEIPLVRAGLEARGLRVKSPHAARLSAIVGDPLRSYQVRG